MNRIAYGLLFLVMGVLLLLPGTGKEWRKQRDWQFRVMPWLRRVPGSRMWSDDETFNRMQRLICTIVGPFFAVFGLLTLFGIIELN